MQRTPEDVNVEEMSMDDINELEELRLSRLKEANIDENEVIDRTSKNNNDWSGYFNENITRGKDDMNFVLRDQWTAIERSEFSRLFKPAMTFNKLYPDVKKVVGEQRKNKPDLMVRSLNGAASQEEIDLRANLVRTISYHSQNDLIYQTAFRSALLLGFGAFQVMIDYEGPLSFNKVIRYGLIPDATLCSWDPTAIKPHKGDGNFCSRQFIFTRNEFFATYPYVMDPISFSDPLQFIDMQWQLNDTIVVCDTFVKEWYPVKILRLSNGDTVTEKQWEERQKGFSDRKELVKGSIVGEIVAKEIPTVVQTRQTQDYKVMNYRMLQNQIIDFSEWPSRHLPIPFVDGDSYWIEGRQYTKSYIHEARDAQKCVNYFNSEIASEIKNRRREQWLATPDNISGYEQMWRNPETQLGALMARPDPKTGQMPMKQQPWDVSPQIMANAQRATQDMREILGISESEDMQGKDISGKARRERKIETSMATYVYFDNLNQAVEQGGRIVNDLLPYVIGEDERMMTLSMQNGKSKKVIFNDRSNPDSVKNVLKAGDFDVEIDTGPSFAIQKDVALEFFQQLLQAFPQAAPFVIDLYAKNLDLQFMPQIVERLENLVPPEILAKEKGEPPPPPKPDPQQQAMQMQQAMMQQEMQLKQAQIQERAEELQLRHRKHQLEEAELIFEAQKMQADMEKDKHQQALDLTKADMDFQARMAKILADEKQNHKRLQFDVLSKYHDTENQK